MWVVVPVSSATSFYDHLASDYHLIFADWDASMARQAVVLDTPTGH
jgi:hypothetical protein